MASSSLVSGEPERKPTAFHKLASPNGACVTTLTTLDTTYCRLVDERVHGGCAVACGQTWSKQKKACVRASARPLDATKEEL